MPEVLELTCASHDLTSIRAPKADKIDCRDCVKLKGKDIVMPKEAEIRGLPPESFVKNPNAKNFLQAQPQNRR